MGLNARHDDVYVASYPRSGTTWLQSVLHEIRTGGGTSFRHINDVVPYLEVSLQAGADLNMMRSPRIFKTHLPFSVVGMNPGRHVYIERDGRDVLVSYFHFYRSYYLSEMTLAEFVDCFLKGQVRYGSWFKHVAGWRSHKDDPRVLVLRYEDLIDKFTSCLRELADFLRWPLPDDGTCAVIEKRCSFDAMRHEEIRFAPVEANASCFSNVATGQFIRRGGAGQWREYLSPDQIKAFDIACKEHCIES